MAGNTISRDLECRLPGSWPELGTEIGPVEQVFNTVELCEQVLEYLPCADLNRARRVCRQFKAVISQLTLMRQRSSLHLASNQILWANPNDILLTGIYAEDHIAAMKAKGRSTDEFVVYELHPYLKVVHHTDEGCQYRHKMLWHQGYCLHEVHVGDFCLLNFPDHFPLDDEYITRPPVKEIEVNMTHTHEDMVDIRNNDGIKFKDIRAAVKDYLIEYAYDTNWHPCSNTTTFIELIANVPRPHSQRWIMKSDPSMAYDYKQILFDCACFCIVIAFSFRVYLRLTIFDIVILIVILVLLKECASVPIIPTRTMTVLSEGHPNKLRRCGHSILFHNGVPITTEERLTLETIGVITKTNDPYCRKPAA